MTNEHDNSLPNFQNQKLPSEFWAYVTAFGALWGAIELTLGTLLHTLRFPKTGLIMVSLTLIVLIAQRQIYPKRGSTIATAIVAACIKSLSPGGIILGPMMGILSEGILVELALLLAPRAFPSAILAGMFATLFSQLQGFLKQIIFYGNDMINIYMAIINKFFKQTPDTNYIRLTVFILIIIIAAIGALAAIFGYFIGKQSIKELQSRPNLTPSPQPHLSSNNAISNQTPDLSLTPRNKQITDEQTYRTRLIAFPIVITCIALQFTGSLWGLALALLILLSSFAFLSRATLKSLYIPKFWLITFAIALIGGLILGWRFQSFDDFKPILALEASYRMIVRGAFVFSIISWATKALKPEEILKIWSKIGLPNQGIAITCAYEILPLWITRLKAYIDNRPKAKLFTHLKTCLFASLIDATLIARQISTPESYHQIELTDPLLSSENKNPSP